MKDTKTLKMSFVDEGGNSWTLSILNPKNSVSSAEAKSVADTITGENLVNGKQGNIKTYNGAVIISRHEEVLWLWKTCCLIFQILAFPLLFLVTY